MKPMLIKTAILALVFQGIARIDSFSEPAPVPTWETKPEVAGILACVPPLQHPFPKRWQPTLYWWQAPLSFDNPKKLKAELRGLTERGLSSCIVLEAEYNIAAATIAKRVAEAKAIDRAGYPVNIQMNGALNLYRLPDGKLVVHADSPDAGKKGDVGEEFPCLLLRDGWDARAKHIRGLMEKFAAAGVRVAAVWYDYEGMPYVWNGELGHLGRCPSCQKQFKDIARVQKTGKDLPPLSDGFDVWVAWATDFWAEAVTEAFAKPVRAVYPSAKIGFYGFTVSSPARPTGGAEVNPPEIDVVQPVCYAQPVSFAQNYFGTPGKVPQRELDQAYFLGLLGGVTGQIGNLRANQLLMPFVCGYCDGNGVALRMSRSIYREFLRHAILRGARGFYCFNTAPPYTAMVDYYSELADINAVYNELFAYRRFLEGGEPINQDWMTPITPVTAKGDWRQPSNTNTWSRGATVNGIRVWLPTPKVKEAAVWSGLRKGDEALIRVVALGETAAFLDATPFPGVTVRLLASPAGATYIVDRSGHTRSVE